VLARAVTTDFPYFECRFFADLGAIATALDISLIGDERTPRPDFVGSAFLCATHVQLSGPQMKRRTFITALSASLSLGPWSARAQSRPLPVIGYLGPEDPVTFATRLDAFRKGLAAMGIIEGRDVAFEYRWAESRHYKLPALAEQLANRNVAVMVAPGGAPAALAARSVTQTIPIVFEMGADPVALGLVDSLSRPGNNLTGISSLSVEVTPKRLEFMRELLPGAKLLCALVNPTSATAEAQIAELQKAARILGLELRILNASLAEHFEAVFEELLTSKASGLVVSSDPFLGIRGPMKLAELSQRHAVPAVHQSRDFSTAGGLMSYGGNFTESHYQTGVYTARILKGEKPADLPVQQVTTFEMVVNLKTAKAFGLTLPPALLLRADVVIE
jgi:putative tryptophan/tyrosine transport system substrate-binding protein